jgi:hypothetical protein
MCTFNDTVIDTAESETIKTYVLLNFTPHKKRSKCTFQFFKRHHVNLLVSVNFEGNWRVIFVSASYKMWVVLTKMNKNYRSFKLNQNPFRIYGYQRHGWTDTTCKFCVDSYSFSVINAQGTQEVSQEWNKRKDGLNMWPGKGRKNHTDIWIQALHIGNRSGSR